jgi:hypothetical protein
LNLQTLLDAQLAECRESRDKIVDLEQQLLEREAFVNKQRHDLEDSDRTIGDLHERLMKERHVNMFRDVDDDDRKKADAANRNLNSMQKDLLEKTMGENSALLSRVAELETRLNESRVEIRQLRDEVDEYTLKMALSQLRRQQINANTRVPQTKFMPAVKGPPKPVVEAPVVEPPDEAPVVVEVAPAPLEQVEMPDVATEFVSQLELQQEPVEPSSLRDEAQPDPVEVIETQDSSPRMNQAEDAMASGRLSEGEDDIEWGEDDPIAEDTYDPVLIEAGSKSSDGPSHRFEDDLYQGVHDPLPLNHRKSKRSVFSKDPTGKKKRRERKVAPARLPIVQSSQSDAENLGIGFNGKMPTRSIQTPTGGTRCTHTPLVPAPKQVPLDPVLPSQSIPEGYGRRMPSPVVARPARLPDLKPVPRNDQTFRITSVQFDSPPVSPCPTLRILRDQPPELIVGPLLGARPEPSVNFDAIQRIIAKLKKSITALRDACDDKDELIAELKQKISSLTADLHRSKIDVVRERDMVARARLRADSCSAKLDAVMSELAERQTEMARLRQELIKMRYATIPAASQLQRMTRARREQLKLRREQEITQALLVGTQAMIGKAQDKGVRTYLTQLAKHARQSMLRMEFKRRYWKEIEKKQMMAALSALSLLAQDRVELPLDRMEGMKLFRGSPIRRTVSLREESDDELIEPLQEKDREKPPPLYGETLALIGQVSPPLSDEEKLAIIHRQLKPALEQRIREAEKENAPEPIATAVVTNS